MLLKDKSNGAMICGFNKLSYDLSCWVNILSAANLEQRMLLSVPAITQETKSRDMLLSGTYSHGRDSTI